MTDPAHARRRHIPTLPFRPPDSDLPDFEILTVSALRERILAGMLSGPHRYDFHLTILVSQGQCTQVVDFEPVVCSPGTVLNIQAGQAHVCGIDEAWEGWLILFRPEFLPSALTVCPTISRLARLETLPAVQQCSSETHSVLSRLAGQMLSDAQSALPRETRTVLLRHQLCTLLVRLLTLSATTTAKQEPASGAHTRFMAFKALLEKNHARWHKVSDYAHALHCSEKSLSRATREINGATPKDMITARQVLEAKRLLAHGRESVAEIGRQLGFNDPTNFVKFFRRETNTKPTQFRQTQTVSGRRESAK